MRWLETMVHRALIDPYLNELTRKLEYKYAHNFLYQKDDILLSEKEFDDVLRFADILSRSSEAEGRNKAYIIDCLKKGVAFHFGRLPQRIRERVEKLFEDKVIDYIFCTSTLLEGVNLPAKNIFIFSNAIGNSKFSDVDFWNLAGRAGRLSKELSGNIICVRMEEKKNRWDNPNKDLEVVRNKKIEAVKPLVINGQKNFYINLEHSLRQIDFTKDSYTQNEKEVWDHYANIVFSHQASKTDSILMSNFLRRNTDGKKLLERMEKDNHIPLYILEQCSNIKAIYQNKVWVKIKESERAFPEEITYQTCLEVLERMYD